MIKDEVERVLKHVPILGAHGYVTPRMLRLFPGMSIEEERAALLSDDGLREIEICRGWIFRAVWTKTVSPDGPGSYGAKHVVERNTGHYVTNGAFIAAAMLTPMPIRRESGGSPNAVLGINRRWYHRQSEIWASGGSASGH